MRRAALLGLLLAGCSGPPAPGQPYFPGEEWNWSYVQHLGDKVLVGTDATDATVELKLTNQATGQVQQVPLGGTKGTVTLDAATLPGFDAAKDVQAFDVAVTMQWHGSSSTRSTTFLLTTDPEAKAFPPVPTEFADGPLSPPFSVPSHWRSTSSDEGPAAFVKKLMEAWQITSPQTGSVIVARSEATLLARMSYLPAEAQLVRYQVKATFPKYVVPADYTRDGQAKVLAPTQLELTLSHTDPADFVALKVD